MLALADLKSVRPKRKEHPTMMFANILKLKPQVGGSSRFVLFKLELSIISQVWTSQDK